MQTSSTRSTLAIPPTSTACGRVSLTPILVCLLAIFLHADQQSKSSRDAQTPSNKAEDLKTSAGDSGNESNLLLRVTRPPPLRLPTPPPPRPYLRTSPPTPGYQTSRCCRVVSTPSQTRRLSSSPPSLHLLRLLVLEFKDRTLAQASANAISAPTISRR